MNKKLSTLLFEENNIDNIFENSEAVSKQITSPLDEIYNKIKIKSPKITLTAILLSAITEEDVKSKIEDFLEIANNSSFITTDQSLYKLIEQFINTNESMYFIKNKKLPQVSRYFLKSNTENSITFKEFIEYVRKASAGEFPELKLNQIELCLSNVYKHVENGYKDLAEMWLDPAKSSTDEKTSSKEEQTQEEPNKESSSTEEQDKEAVDEDVVEANEEQFRTELVNLLVEVDKEFQQKADEIATKAAESKDTRQKVGFGLGATVGAALGLTAAVSMGPIGLLAFGPAIVAGSTGLGAFGLGALGGATAKDVDAKGSVKAQIDKDSKILLDEIIKLISKELQEESFIYRSRLSSLLFEQETKNKQVQWEKIERILKAKSIGPYKAALKGSVSDSQLDEMIAFSSALVDIIEKNFPVKVANFNYKFSLDDLVKKRNEAARQRGTMNMKAKTGQPINAGFDAMIDQLLAQPNISEGIRNQLSILKIMNNSGIGGVEKLTQETLKKALKEAGNPGEEYNLNQEAADLLGIEVSKVEKILSAKKSDNNLSTFPDSEIFKKIVNLFKDDIEITHKNIVNEIAASLQKDKNIQVENDRINEVLETKINQEFLDYVKYFSTINKDKEIYINLSDNNKNPFEAILLSFLVENVQEYLKFYDNSNDTIDIEKLYLSKLLSREDFDNLPKDSNDDSEEEILDNILDAVGNKILDIYNRNIDDQIKSKVQDKLGEITDQPIEISNLKDATKDLLGIKKVRNENKVLDDNLLREEWLRIWEIKK